MKSAFLALALIAGAALASAADTGVNWSSDDDSLPEVLPKKMRDKGDDQIQTAVFRAYENQLKVVSEYSAHALDPESPLGYFKDEMPVSNARTSSPQADLVFYNNGIRGFAGQTKNSIVVKWVPDQVITEIGWKELSVRGRYTFVNATYFNQGKYLILLQDVKYLAGTPLSENTESYPSTVPKSSLSYKTVKATFTGGLPDVVKTSDSPNVRKFVEDIVFQQVADRVVKDTHNNVTAAIRLAVKPYLVFKNDTDQYFPGTTGKLTGAGAAGYSISNTVVSGFGNAEQRVKKVVAKMAANAVTVDLRMSVHGLDGRFDYKVDESKPVAGKATFAVGRIDVGVSFNALKPAECKCEVTVNQPTVKYGAKLAADGEKALTAAFADNVKSQLSANVCKAFGLMTKPGKL